MTQENQCAIYQDVASTYAGAAPFHPSVLYPEYELGPGCVASETNSAYEAVRNLFMLLELDAANAGTASWNPLKDIIRPGDLVAIKPNFVLHFNAAGHDLHSVVTHGSLIRPVIDYVLKALNGTGRVIVADAPHGNADFEAITRFTGIDKVVEFYRSRGANVVLSDLRKYRYAPGKEGFLKDVKTPLKGDPEGYTAVDLGAHSEFRDLDALERLYGADFDRSIIRQHHNEHRHEYLIANSILKADVVISMPKLKVHSKAGVTINLKNLVGINGDKNWLPHYRVGHPGERGDEFPRSSVRLENALRRFDRLVLDKLLAVDGRARKLAYRTISLPQRALMRCLTKVSGNPIYRGSWRGNDTIWRTVLDLNRILLFADKDGHLQNTQQRRFISIVDGLIGGEGDGPLSPTPKHSGVVLGGFNPLLVDFLGARLIGFDPERILLFKNAYRTRPQLSTHTLEAIRIRSNVPAYENLNRFAEPHLAYSQPIGWTKYRDIPRSGLSTDATELAMEKKGC